MSLSTKKFLDSAGVSYLWGKIAAEVSGVQSQVDTISTSVSGINTKLGTLPTGQTSFASWIQAVQNAGYNDTEIRNLITTNANDIDALEILVGNTAVATQISNAITALNLSTTYAGKAYESKVDTLVGTTGDAGKSVRAIANEELAAQLIPENAAESLDTLQEIAAWIQAHPADASAMNTSITTLQGLVGSTGVGDQIDAKITALNLSGTYYSKANGEANAAAITAIKDGTSIDSFADVETALAGKQATIPANTYDAYGAASTAKSEVIGTSSDASTADTIYGAKAYSASQAAAVVGTSSDTSASSTVYGAKKYTDSKVATVVGTSSDTSGAVTIYGAKAYADDVYAAVAALSNSEIDTAIANASST